MSFNQPCPVCGHLPATPFLDKAPFRLVKCPTCAMIYVDPMPSVAALAGHYQNPAYFAGEESQGYANYSDMKKVLVPLFQRRIAEIERALPGRGRILDFGCAAGYFLEVAKDHGWTISGVELSADMRSEAMASLKINICASIDECPDQNLDALTLWEVIEHLPDPLVQLRRLFNRIRPGGVIMLSTPNNANWRALTDPQSWTVFRPPSHLVYFTSATLTELLHRAGFTNILVRGIGPAPRLPPWLDRLTTSLRTGLVNGQSRYWKLSLATWRAVRAAAWIWQKLAHPNDDVYSTIEAQAMRPMTPN